MKKSIKMIALAMAMLLACMAFAACSAAGNVHELKSTKGVVLMTDDAIDTSDTAAQTKIESYLDANGVTSLKESFSAQQLEAEIYAKGNAMVFELNITMELTAEQEAAAQEAVKPMLSSTDIKEGRADAGVDNMVLVYAFISKDGKVLAADILK